MVPETIKIEKDGTIHIVLSIWDLADTYNRHASVTMVSILENTKSSVHFHLLYDKQRSEINKELSKINYNKYLELKEKYNTKIDFNNVSVPESVKNLPFVKVYTEGALLRFFIPDLFQEYDKILYLDTDIVVRTDIAALWDIDISEKSVAATRMPLPRSYQRKYQKHNINPSNYFNSGVILFNLEHIRQTSNIKADDFFKHLLSHSDFECPDQDVLNLCFNNSILPLPEKYNFGKQLDRKSEYNDMIIHFKGRVKPWKAYLGGADRYYWHYLLKSPWGKNREEIMEYILEAPSMEISLSRLPLWLSSLWPNKLLPKILEVSLKIPCRVIYYDIRYIVLHRILGRNSI